MSRYKNSLEYLERAKKVTPGAAQTLSKMPARFPQGAFPFSISHGSGATITDIDGNKYVDWIGALGAVPLGYSHQGISQYVAARFITDGGASFSLPHIAETDLAERLCSKIPCAEMVRFVNSGSEATEAAIRTARIATGRDIILTVKSGYHSWFSTFQILKDWHPGIPKDYGKVIKGFDYNDTSGIEELLYKFRDKVAAVILEPCLFEKPKPAFLECARTLTEQYGALLIFDEMVLGFRLALAGGQEYFGVTPDLATFGKGMANGLPIGMLCGKREYMQHAELISGTFGGNAVSLAAANAVLDVYESEPVIDTMCKRGEQLQNFFNKSAHARMLETFAVCDGYPCKPRFRFSSKGPEVNDKAMSLFLQVTAEYGMLAHPGGLNVCYALTDDDMKITFHAVTEGLDAIEHAVNTDDWSALKGDIIKPVVTVRQ